MTNGFDQGKKLKIHYTLTEGATSVETPKIYSEEAAGYDISAAEDLVLYPGEKRLVKTGLRIAIPRGYHVEVRPRSGISLKTNISLVNSPGTVDSDYRDELGLILENTFKYNDILTELLNKPHLLSLLKSDYRHCTFKEFFEMRAKQLIKEDSAKAKGHADAINDADVKADSDLTNEAAAFDEDFLDTLPAEMLSFGVWLDREDLPYGCFKIQKGMRLAQLVVSQNPSLEFVPHPNVSELGSDRGGGFGHTGS